MTTQDEPQTPPPASSGDEFRPSAPRSSRSKTTAYSTPRSDIVHGSQLPTAAKEHIALEAPAGKRCLITLDIEPIDYCHLLARSTWRDTTLMKKLEYAWGFEPGSLCLNTSKNVLHLRSDLHRAFDANCWALVPPATLLGEIFHATGHLMPGPQRYYLDVYPKGPREYQFCHFQGAPRKFIRPNRPETKSDVEADEEEDKDKSKSKSKPQLYDVIYRAPFRDFWVSSHVHPYFVICNVAIKYRELIAGKGLPKLPGDLKERVVNCDAIMRLWETLQPPKQPSPPPQPPSEPPSTTRSTRSGSRSTYSRATRSSHRPPNSNTDNPNAPDDTRSRDSGGTKRKRKRGASSSVSVRSLQTPNASQGQTKLGAVDLAEVDSSECHPLNIRSWAKDVYGKLDANSPGAKLALEEYSQERSRQPPTTPWDQRKPDRLDGGIA